MNIEFEQFFTRFALFKDDYVICVISDKHKLTVHEQMQLIQLTDSEIVKIHVNQTHRMVEEVNRFQPTNLPVDPKVIGRKGAFKSVKPEVLNKPIPVKYVPNIQTKHVEKVRSTVFCNEEGKVFPFPSGMPSDEVATLAKLLNAEFVLGDFEVTTEYLLKASPHRSQAEI